MERGENGRGQALAALRMQRSFCRITFLAALHASVRFCCVLSLVLFTRAELSS